MARQEPRSWHASARPRWLLMFRVPASAEARYAARTLTVGSHRQRRQAASEVPHQGRLQTPPTASTAAGRRRTSRAFERQKGRAPDGRATPADQRVLKRRGQAAGPADPRQLDASATGGSAYDGGDRQSGPPRPAPLDANPTGKATLSSDGRTAVAPDDAPPGGQGRDRRREQDHDEALPLRRRPRQAGRTPATTAPAPSATRFTAAGSSSSRSTPPASRAGARPARATWITVFANSGHAYAVIAGLRFDTLRWREQRQRPALAHASRARSSGYVARHPVGF